MKPAVYHYGIATPDRGGEFRSSFVYCEKVCVTEKFLDRIYAQFRVVWITSADKTAGFNL
jgi:hypothetical protein